MHDDDLLQQIAAANPVPRAALHRLDDAAGAALREGILMTAAPETTRETSREKRRVGRRGVLAGGLAVALVGGGLAYAAVERGRYEGGGGQEGPSCMTTWVDPTTEAWDPALVTGGPAITGDPVADCQEYQALSGREPIADAVAFTWGSALYVAPRDQVPDGAELLAPDADAGAVHELWLSVHDYVGGLGAQCLDVDAAVAAAQAELDRLGLADWTVELTEPDAPRPEGDVPNGPCADVRFAVDPEIGSAGLPDDARSRTLLVAPESRADREAVRGNGVAEFAFEVRDALRSQISGQCLDLAAAQAVAVEALGPDDPAPAVALVDGNAACTRAYLVVGGDLRVTLYGPESVD